MTVTINVCWRIGRNKCNGEIGKRISYGMRPDCWDKQLMLSAVLVPVEGDGFVEQPMRDFMVVSSAEDVGLSLSVGTWGN